MLKLASKKENISPNCETEFEWVLKVMGSSKNVSHTIASQQLFENYLKKWDRSLDLTKKSKKSLEFNKLKNEVLSKIFKKS